MKWYYIVIAILFIKIILNLSKFLQCKYLLNKYIHWLKDTSLSLVEKKSKVISLIKGVGVSDSCVPYIAPVGYGKLVTNELSVLNNFPSNRRDIFELTREKFHDAIGVYRRRILQTFNPLFWIETVIFLPKKILVYLGVKNSESVVIKLLQIVWWGFGILIAVLIAVYQQELAIKIKPFIQNILEKFAN
jgi:hypothetical protein